MHEARVVARACMHMLHIRINKAFIETELEIDILPVAHAHTHILTYMVYTQ